MNSLEFLTNRLKQTAFIILTFDLLKRNDKSDLFQNSSEFLHNEKFTLLLKCLV